MSAIYLHIPLCKRLCGYCDFFKSVKLQAMEPLLDAMEVELRQRVDFLEDKSIETIYFGGGTPSLVPPSRIASLMAIISELYDVSALREVTLEANPDDISPQYLADIKAAGINRLSIGVQSFDDRVLQLMNRRHSAAQARAAVEMARAAGFDNITVDIIFGVDGFGTEHLEQSIRAVLELGVQHISAYHLTIEPNTPFARKVASGSMSIVEESTSQLEYLLIDRLLCDAGFEHYEVSNYAMPGFRSRHNSSYWRGVSYLGIGAGAHSFNGVQRCWAVESIDSYLSGCGDERYEVEQLTLVDMYNEMVMTRLRCCEGLDMTDLRRRFPATYCDYLIAAAQGWLQHGALVLQGERLYIPQQQMLLSDAIIEELFYGA